MLPTQDEEMTDIVLSERFATLVEEAAVAFSIDPNYVTEVIQKAKSIQARRARRNLASQV